MGADRPPRSILGDVKETRSSLSELLSLAVIAALGINLVSGTLSSFLGDKVSVILGSALVGLVTAYVVAKKLKKRALYERVNAVFLTIDEFEESAARRPEVDDVDNQEYENGYHRVSSIPGYGFSEEFRRLTRSLFAENQALHAQWKKEPFRLVRRKISRNESNAEGVDARGREKRTVKISRVRMEVPNNASVKLVKEVVEFMLLQRLSSHLRDYFGNADRFKKQDLVDMERNDVPAVLLSNRAFALFTGDVRDRVGFDPLDGVDGDEDEAEVFMIQSGSYYYSRFELTLPKGSKVERIDTGHVRIFNKSMSLELEVDFHATNASLPLNFSAGYLGSLQDDGKITAWRVSVHIRASVRSRIIAYGKKHAYHAWLDSIIESFRRDLDFDAFKEEISWMNANATMRAIAALMNRRARAESKKPELKVIQSKVSERGASDFT
ncbi:hypothetical protein SAMN04489727_9263 [Amycolatopsis tolypomycina]|uniref:Uncharacterized protein n=1 Tax=Amycolatopsis tolypomycina TaxID=208445 RepID=A0A1H5DAZ9_9PSEU|nr:hypothetical protein [Amycolatopsis tolypomycina]SED76006.1 hypothetical protein SAMN04489727_9263 [Amycolatopsis tolypomycina]